MTIFFENLNTLWGSLVVEELVRHKVELFCISPGSRSTPLTVAVARHPAARGKIFYDERAAAFFALGYARATGKVAPLIATSGTAVANYYPALIEAAVDLVPLLVLSADRPPELQQTGANQTITQTNLFGGYVKWHFQFPAPDENVAPSMVLTSIDQAVYQAHSSPAGPVHLNFQFRDPLEPTPQRMSMDYLKKIDRWIQGDQPYTTYTSKINCLSPVDLEKVLGIINSTRKGFISVGHLKTKNEQQVVQKLINKINWPYYADITSGLRLKEDSPTFLNYFELLLGSNRFLKEFKPTTIIHFGGPVTSKKYWQFLETKFFQNFLVIKNDPNRYDPSHVVTHRVETDLVEFCTAIGNQIKVKSSHKWKTFLSESNQLVEKVLNEKIDTQNQLTEPGIIRILSQFLSEKEALFLSSSLPIREMDWYSPPQGKGILIGANRGASGIDGTIATAMGFSEGLKKPLLLFIGDIAFVHDLNSLSLIEKADFPILIILLNNKGGGIFSFLPVRKFTSFFEEYFATPHHITFKSAADLFNISYALPPDKDAFIRYCQNFRKNKRSMLIEIQTDRNENYNFQKNLLNQINKNLEK
jgi:2-succinyl-5-enolpyruvyl-6-hydroxy-3-cyclohexene-1-carboxylate synthase